MEGQPKGLAWRNPAKPDFRHEGPEMRPDYMKNFCKCKSAAARYPARPTPGGSGRLTQALHQNRFSVMGKKTLRVKTVVAEARAGKKLCPFCSGGDGGKKEIYDSPEDAMSTANHIKKERGVDLKVYKCPHETGWHLTKDNAEDGAGNSTRKILWDNGIPLSSRYNGSVLWEYVEESPSPPGAYAEEPAYPLPRKPPRGAPEKNIERIEAREKDKNIPLEGRVVEIVKSVSIESIFKIDLNNLFSAGLAKDFTDGEYQQLTIHAVRGGGRTLSYTVLVKKTFMREHKIRKDDTVKLVVSGKRVNNKTVWRCEGG
jgi:hypothetical protein